MVTARHSSATPRWGTPPDIVARSRVALGGRIELDPFSEPAFNAIVGAERFYTAQDDAFAQPWIAETCFVNPPGGAVVNAWRRLVDEWCSQRVDQAIWVGFSVEQLAQLANEHHHPLDFSWCVPRKRIAFTRHDGYTGSPSHSNYICALGVDHNLFESAFGDLGRIGRDSRCVAMRNLITAQRACLEALVERVKKEWSSPEEAAWVWEARRLIGEKMP